MRTLHLDSGREMRGGQWQALRLVEALPGEGVAATLLCRAGSPLFRRASAAGVDVRPLSLARLLILARRYDLVHAHDARSHTLALAAGRPLVVARRVSFPIRSLWKYRRAACLIAVSRAAADVLIAAGVPAARVAVVYDAVPLLDPAGPHERVLAPALADAMKGADLVREAARLAAVQVDFADDFAAALGTAAVFLYITRSEGLGSGALLAMSAAVPVIASAVGGLPEVIVDGETGLLVPNSPPAIAAALRRLLDDPALARAMGASARHSVEMRFSIPRMVRDTIGVYRKVLA